MTRPLTLAAMLLGMLMLSGIGAAWAQPATAPTLVIRSGRLLDTAKGAVREGQWIVIVGDGIAAVHASGVSTARRRGGD